jgi:hypothetical protein
MENLTISRAYDRNRRAASASLLKNCGLTINIYLEIMNNLKIAFEVKI